MNIFVGQPLRRREDLRFITGKGRYVDDMQRPGQLHVAFLRSPHAHASILRLNLSPARALSGVRLVVDGRDLDGRIGVIRPNWIMPGTQVPVRPVLAVERVRFVGECVAAVVAESRDVAYDALELIEI